MSDKRFTQSDGKKFTKACGCCCSILIKGMFRPLSPCLTGHSGELTFAQNRESSTLWDYFANFYKAHAFLTCSFSCLSTIILTVIMVVSNNYAARVGNNVLAYFKSLEEVRT